MPAEDVPKRVEAQRAEEVNQRRALQRGYLVFATDPARAPDERGYREAYVTEARTRHQAIAKVRPLAGERRLRAGPYRHELPHARWVP